MKPWRAVLLLVGIALCFQAAAASYRVVNNAVVGETTRITFLSPTLVRLETSPSGDFVDDPSVLVLNRNWPACPLAVSEHHGWVVMQTGAMQVRWRDDGQPLNAQNLEISWEAGGLRGQWRPGQEDRGNLGGTRGALDGIGRGYLPPLDPGLLSREGWTLLDDSERPLWLGEDGWLRERPDYAARDWYFFAYGHDYAHMLREYVTLCGPIPMLPRYAWGTWYSRYWAFTDQELRQIVNRFRALDIPLDVLVIDVDWHLYGWEGYDWNPELFPDPEGFLQWLHAQGVRVTLNNHPGSPLPVEDSHHAAAAQLAGLSGEALSQPLVWDLANQAHNRAFVEAVHWPLEKMGVDFWWIDGNPAANMRGLDHAMWCAKTYYDGTQRHSGKRSLVFSRYGGLGQHRYPVGFSGDVHSTWDVLNYEVRFTARAGNVAFPYWSHDIGGFLGDRLDPELYVRWCQFGALSPVMRLHSNHGIREPWEYGQQAQEIVADYLRLRQRLYPYLNTCQRQVYETGMPLCRPLYMEWPDLEEAYRNDYEYLLGPNLLVAPITAPGSDGLASREVWIPPGPWWDWWTGEPLSGPKTIVYQAPLERCPMFARAGGIIPMQPEMEFMGEKPADPITLNIWAGADGELSLYEDDGLSLDYQDGGFAITPVAVRTEAEDVSVTVSPRMGSFDGALAERAMELVVRGISRPSTVLVDGRVLPTTQWDYDPDAQRITILTEQRSVEQPLTVVLRGAAPNASQTHLAALKALAACAQDALRLAQAKGLEADRTARLAQLTTAAADAARRVSRAEADAAATRKALWTALAATWAKLASSELEEADRKAILTALIGLSCSAQMLPVPGTTEYEVQVVASVRVPLPDGVLIGEPAVEEPWSLAGEVVSTLDHLAVSGGGTLSFRVSGPTEFAQPPLGLLACGANLTLDYAGAPLQLAARTGLDCSFVQQWHLIGPFPNREARGLDTVFPPEEEIDLSRSYPGLGGEARWQSTAWRLPSVGDDPAVFIDLATRFAPKDQAVAYAVAYILSDREQQALFSVGTDDGCKLWLNGELILVHPEPRPPAPGQDRVQVTLREGVNVVLLKVANEYHQWGLYLQVLGLDGQPLPSLRTTLTPPP